MFEELTCFLPKMEKAQLGEWIVDHENDGSLEHPIHLPFVNYNRVVIDFEEAVYRFVDEHESMGIHRYGDILEKANIKWEMKSMSNADVSQLDGRTVMAIILAAIRAERFCDGALLGFCENGSIAKWLSRLQQIDEQECPGS